MQLLKEGRLRLLGDGPSSCSLACTLSIRIPRQDYLYASTPGMLHPETRHQVVYIVSCQAKGSKVPAPKNSTVAPTSSKASSGPGPHIWDGGGLLLNCNLRFGAVLPGSAPGVLLKLRLGLSIPGQAQGPRRHVGVRQWVRCQRQETFRYAYL